MKLLLRSKNIFLITANINQFHGFNIQSVSMLVSLVNNLDFEELIKLTTKKNLIFKVKTIETFIEFFWIYKIVNSPVLWIIKMLVCLSGYRFGPWL